MNCNYCQYKALCRSTKVRQCTGRRYTTHRRTNSQCRYCGYLQACRYYGIRQCDGRPFRRGY